MITLIVCMCGAGGRGLGGGGDGGDGGAAVRACVRLCLFK